MTKNAEYRKAFLEEVIKTVCADRNVTHGDAEDNFRTIAALWTAYLDAKRGPQMPSLNSADVAVMMALFKCARIAVNPSHMDNWVDLAGYAACGGGIMTPRCRRDEGTKMPAPAEVQQERASGSIAGKSDKIVFLCDGPAGKQLIAARNSNEAATTYAEKNDCPMVCVSVISVQAAP